MNLNLDTVYFERANGRTEYWTFSDGARVYVSSSWVSNQQARGTIELVRVR